MRLGRLAILIGALFVGAANARPAMVVHPANLRSGPGANHPAIATLPARAAVDVVTARRGWSLVSQDGRRGYIASSLLAVEPASPEGAPADGAPSGDPNCGYGYPYSGSGAYFTGLTELRHSGPFGFFLGWHRRWPC